MKKQKLVIDSEHALEIAESLAKKKMSEYETIGDLAKDLRSLFGLIGQFSIEPSKEDTLLNRITALEKENSQLKEKIEPKK